MEDKDVIIVGVAGGSASGKTLFSNTIVDELGSDEVIVLADDAYYHDLSHIPFEERNNFNFDHPKALDHALLAEHLKKLKNWESVKLPKYDFITNERSWEDEETGQYSIIVVEGILVFVDPVLRDMMDIRIFIDTPLDICLMRRITRDIATRGKTLEDVLKQYEKDVRPMYWQFIEPSKQYADICVPRGGHNRIAIDMIKAKMREILSVSV